MLGTSLTGAGGYYYVLDEYKVSNEMLTEDILVRVICCLLVEKEIWTDNHMLTIFPIAEPPEDCPTGVPTSASAGGKNKRNREEEQVIA